MQKILVIDDETMLLDMITMLLNKFGYYVETATNGKEGIQKFDTGRFDLIITDMRMSGIDGNGVVRHIRTSARPFTPIIGISGTPWFLEDSGCDLVIPKPFPIKVLIDSVTNLVTTSSKASPVISR